MGDIANMTDNDGRVNGHRLLRWLRSHAEMAWVRAGEMSEERNNVAFHRLDAQAELLHEMADDLERELTPPDYPEDDGDERSAFMSGPHDPCKRSPGADDEGADLDDKDTGPCESCGRLADRVPVRDNGRVYFACPGCAARADDDTVNLDDHAPEGGTGGV